MQRCLTSNGKYPPPRFATLEIEQPPGRGYPCGGNFESAVTLFEFCFTEIQSFIAFRKLPPDGSLDRFSGWRFLAIRDGAMSIYHFATTHEAIRG
jgi:hypothetical protein